MKKEEKNKGITLIALVITIIVLLILAGVSISALSGNNGILEKTTQAKENTNKSNFNEKVKLATTELKMGDKLNDPMEDVETYLKGKFETVTNNQDGTFTVKDKKYEAIIDTKGNEIQPLKIGEVSKETRKNNYQDNKKTATIPKGFSVLKDCGEIDKGLVITDGKAEFVWIPVPANELNDMFGGPEEDKYGILYEFTAADTIKRYEGNKGSTSQLREPDIVSDYDKNQSYLTIMNEILPPEDKITDFKTTLKEEFNKMYSSVKKYEGFYVGRYESSLGDDKKHIAPIKGATSATADSSSANTWYGLYARQKLYKKDDIQGSMIWGCQYDAMLRWMQKKEIDVTSTTPTDTTTGIQAKGNTSRIAGGEGKDKICNIYDLIGNSFDWTLEASSTYGRVDRRGNYSYGYSPSHHHYSYPTSTSSGNSTRATLYIP